MPPDDSYKPIDPARQAAMVKEAFQLIDWQARRFGSLPPGIDVEELESLGNELIVDALATFPHAEAKGITWNQHVRTTLRSGMLTAIRKARGSRRKTKHGRTSMHNEEGEQIPLTDQKADDPSEVAEAVEEVNTTLAKRVVTAKELEKSLPLPAAVAAKSQILQAAVVAAIQPADVKDVIESMIEKATNDKDVKAAAFVIGLVNRSPTTAPPSPPPTPTAIISIEQEEEVQVLTAVEAILRRGDPGVTRFAIRTATQFDHARVARIIGRLVRMGELVPATWPEVINDQVTTLEGYRLPAQPP